MRHFTNTLAWDVIVWTVAAVALFVTVSVVFGQPVVKSEAPMAKATDSPWLSRAESEAIKALWPKGVAFGKNLKFYDLPQRYQSLSTTNGGRTKLRFIVPLEDHSATLATSGGMHGLRFKSVKGLDVPDTGKIAVWEEKTDVRAFDLVPRWRWTFPIGTVAYDVLFNANDEPFEIRTQERAEHEWITKVVYKEPAKFPSGYAGLQQACASCHSQTGSVVNVDGRIYRHVTWGDDGRFSWRPFKEDNTLDMRWPIVRVD